MKRLVCLLVVLSTTAHAQPSSKRAFALSDWYRVATVRQPAMSPDGNWITFTVTTVLEAPWEKGNIYDAVSPIYFVHNVRTPTLIVHSEEDTRVTIGQGDEWFTALKKQGVPVEYIRYPRSSHELSRSGEPWLLVDRLGRLRDWFTYWLKP